MGQYWNSASLDGKAVIVTGAGQGIGRGIAEALGERGAAVLAVDVVEETVTRAADELSAKGYRVVSLHQDITAEGAAQAIVDRAIAEFGHLDGLVNNAMAGHMPTPFQDVDEAAYVRSFETGPHATFNLMKAAYPHLKAAGGGSVVNFGSGAGTTGLAGFAAYGGAKEAVRGLSKVAAMEWGVDGIRVNVIAPAALTEGMALWRENAPEQFDAMIAAVPLHRVGDVHTDVGAVVAFLIGDDSTYFTAQTFMVDGGSNAVR